MQRRLLAEGIRDEALDRLRDPASYRDETKAYLERVYREGTAAGKTATEIALAQPPIVIDLFPGHSTPSLNDGRHRYEAAKLHRARSIRATIRRFDARANEVSSSTLPLKLVLPARNALVKLSGSTHPGTPSAPTAAAASTPPASRDEAAPRRDASPQSAAAAPMHGADPSAAGDADHRVAAEILRQLGGAGFVTMTGARDFARSHNALTFRLPANFAKEGINAVRITLEPTDTYTIQFSKVGRAPTRRVTLVAESDGIDADHLGEVFRSYTGLETRVPRVFAGTAPIVEAPTSAVVTRPGPEADKDQGKSGVAVSGSLRERLIAYLTVHPAQQATVVMDALGGTDPDEKNRVLVELQTMRKEGIVVREVKDQRKLWSLRRSSATPDLPSAMPAPGLEAAPLPPPTSDRSSDTAPSLADVPALAAPPAETAAPQPPPASDRTSDAAPPPALPRAFPKGPNATVFSPKRGRIPVATIARHGRLFVHASLDDPSRFAVSEDTTGLRVAHYGTMDDARAFMWELNSPKLAAVLDRIVQGTTLLPPEGERKVWDTRMSADAREAATELDRALQRSREHRVSRWREAIRTGAAPDALFVEPQAQPGAAVLAAPTATTPAKPPRRTFAEVRTMLLAGLREHGWTVNANLQHPHAEKDGRHLWFWPEAVKAGSTTVQGEARSLSSDMREYLDVDALLRDVERWFAAPPPAPAADATDKLGGSRITTSPPTGQTTPDWKPTAATGRVENAEADHDEALSPVEHRTAAARRDANIKAMWLAADLETHPRPLTDEDRLTLAAYSDWGGIGKIKPFADKFPPGFPAPEARQLIHAYYTPPDVCAEIARVVRPLLDGLVGADGHVHALEPSVGIGRFPLAFSGPGFESVIWHAVEFSVLSYKMLHALRPDMDLYQGPFERWVAERGSDFAGRLNLVVSNPPYGERGFTMADDPDRTYRYKRADQYFLRRGLDLLAPGGLGVYIIPSGFLTANDKNGRAMKLREEVLRRHHLSAAFRLPNEVFSLANVVTDILFFRARSGLLAEVDEADKFILEGRYYEQFPAHVLGTIVPDEPGKTRGWHTSADGYRVEGKFTALPPKLEERPMCAVCAHAAAVPPPPPPPARTPASPVAAAEEQAAEGDERMEAAIALGRRVEAFLGSMADPEIEPVGWQELHDDLVQWAAVNGAPAQDQAVLSLANAERGPAGKGPPGGAGWLLKAFLGKSATLIEPLAEKPRWTPRFIGNPNDPLQVADYVYRSRKTLTIDDLPGKDPSALFAAGWCEDSVAPGWTERLDVRGELFPADEYLFGELWPRFDRAQARAALGDPQAAAQAARLIEIIKPATFDEIEVTPQDGFVPLDLLSGWLTTKNDGDPVTLVREKGLVHVADVAYDDLTRKGLTADALSSLSPQAAWILGWVNHDYVVFQPGGEDGEKVDELRLSLETEWTQGFRAWLEADPSRQRAIERSYQRARQGYRAHGYGAEPLKLARWNPAVVLNPHQVAGARRIDANRGGGLGFDVGVGKTFTICAALALARQAGRARRPVIVVPQSIAFQWVNSLKKTLPDFRVVVIGINKTTIARGLRKGLETSETDTPEERSRKWARFQGGEFDVAVLTYDSLPRTQMDRASTLAFIDGVTAIEREVELRRRNAKKAQQGKLRKYEEDKAKLARKLDKAQKAEQFLQRHGIRKKAPKVADVRAQLAELEKKHLGSLTERQDAVLTEGIGAWLAEMLELPATWKPDPDIIWNKIGVDWIAFDEAHNGKNLHMPSSREGGSVPKFMGNEGEGSKRAWHWFFRCCDVQSRDGEVIVATATPASNSPLELYNLVKLVDKDAWTRIGIGDPEAFIDRFCLLEPQEVLTAEMETETCLACVGFKNLDELRSVIFKYWEFKTAKQANLKLPAATVERVFVDMDAEQEEKYVEYVKEIEEEISKPKIPGQPPSNKILGLLARMAMVAIHSQLDEKYDWSNAAQVANKHSPKFDALAKKILAQKGCGHIVFVDYLAAHVWVRDVLIEAGIPAGRIGILNRAVAPSAADRLRVAREFNGDAHAGIAPKYDVLIANAIGEEGVDLQERTCAIHHLDIGWTPKKTEQRNGRGVRQGNTLANINIFYYIANRSQDGVRLDMVRGKQNWISSLLEGEAKDTNNPAAQSTLSRKELLCLISRDPEKTRQRLEAAEAEREEQRKAKLAKAATDTLRAVANRFARARTEPDPAIAAEYVSVAKQKLAGLAKVQPEVWPWAGWATAAEQHPMLVPKEGGPVYEGLRVATPRLLDRSVIDFAEFGRVAADTIGMRAAGTAHWDEIGLDRIVQLRLEPQMRLAEGRGASWPSDDQTGIDDAMRDKWLHRFRHGAGAADAWRELGWMHATNAFAETQWAHWGDEIVKAMASTGGWAANLRAPAIRDGRLVLGLTPPFTAVLPPTDAGWAEFLRLAPHSGLKFTEIADAGLFWWDRRIPPDLLSAARKSPGGSNAEVAVAA